MHSDSCPLPPRDRRGRSARWRDRATPRHGSASSSSARALARHRFLVTSRGERARCRGRGAHRRSPGLPAIARRSSPSRHRIGQAAFARCRGCSARRHSPASRRSRARSSRQLPPRARGAQRVREAEVGFRKLGCDRERAPVACLRVIAQPQVLLDVAEVVQQHRMIGCECERAQRSLPRLRRDARGRAAPCRGTRGRRRRRAASPGLRAGSRPLLRARRAPPEWRRVGGGCVAGRAGELALRERLPPPRRRGPRGARRCRGCREPRRTADAGQCPAIGRDGFLRPSHFPSTHPAATSASAKSGCSASAFRYAASASSYRAARSARCRGCSAPMRTRIDLDRGRIGGDRFLGAAEFEQDVAAVHVRASEARARAQRRVVALERARHGRRVPRGALPSSIRRTASGARFGRRENRLMDRGAARAFDQAYAYRRSWCENCASGAIPDASAR